MGVIGSGWLRCPETGKKAYVTREVAERELDAMIRNYAAPGHRVPRYSYRCDDCGWWHLSAGRGLGLQPKEAVA